MKVRTMCTSWAGMPAAASRPRFWRSWSRMRILQHSCLSTDRGHSSSSRTVSDGTRKGRLIMMNGTLVATAKKMGTNPVGSTLKVVVIGGTGLIGSKLVAKLGEHGHDAVAAAPNTGVNTLTGEGLAQVLQGASVVVDVSNSPSFEDAAVLNFFETSTRNLLAAEAEAGVKHHVALSVVGTERLQESGYFRA